MGLKQKIVDCIPDAYYPDGSKTTCLKYRIYNMFDIDKDSYVEDKEKLDFDISDDKT